MLQNGLPKNNASSLPFASTTDSELLNNDNDIMSPDIQSPISSIENVSNNPFNINLSEITNKITKSRIKKKRKIGNDENNNDNLDMASKMGLPDGWTTTVEKNGTYKFTGPDGDPIIKSKRSLISYFGFNPELKLKTLPIPITHDGDPKWRTSDNFYLGVRLLFSPNNSEENINGCRGTVSGWISKNDKDKDGKPGYESVVTGKKEASDLYHIVYDSSEEFVDLEEYEIKEILHSKDEKLIQYRNAHLDRMKNLKDDCGYKSMENYDNFIAWYDTNKIELKFSGMNGITIIQYQNVLNCKIVQMFEKGIDIRRKLVKEGYVTNYKDDILVLNELIALVIHKRIAWSNQSVANLKKKPGN